MNRAQAIQASVSILDVMDVLGIHHHGQGTYQISCPNPAHEDVNPSARVFGGTNSVYCWTCGKTWDVVGLVQVVKGIGFNAACDIVENKFGEVSFDRDPLWVKKIQHLKRHGFTTDGEVVVYARLIQNIFIDWYRKEYPAPPLYAWEFYTYWFSIYDEMRRLSATNADKIKLYTEWLSFGQQCITELMGLPYECVSPAWKSVRTPTHKGAKCSWYYLPREQDVWSGGRERLHAFRDIWGVAFEIREHAHRIATNR